MKKNSIAIISGAFCMGLLLLASCTKMDNYYKDFVVERIYVGKPDSIWIQPGDQRVQVGMLTPVDAEAKDLIVRWGKDSVVVPIDHEVDTNKVIIGNLEERDYVFEAYTADRKGHRSVPMELSTPVYGDVFRASMWERNFSHSATFPDSVALVWNTLGQLETLYGSEVEFTDKSGTKKKALLPKTEIGVFYDADPSKPITVRDVYRPEANAFEYFYTDPVTMSLEETKKNTLTLASTGYTIADYIDFKFVRTFLEDNIPMPKAVDIDLCYTLGGSSRANLFTMNSGQFSAFASSWQTLISSWETRNAGQMKLDRSADAVARFDGLEETERTQMAAAYNNASSDSDGRYTLLGADDVIYLHSEDRDLYVAIKIISGPSATVADPLVIEFKVSRL